jgi:hypothetical protein
MDADARDAARGFEPEMGPRPTAAGRFVHAVAVGGVAADARFGMPAYTISGFDPATASAPTDPVNPSDTLRQPMPPSSVFQMPQPVAPK